MDKSSNLAKAIELGKTHVATLLNMKELAQVQCDEATVYEVRREEPAAIVKDSIQSLREINAQPMVQPVVGVKPVFHSVISPPPAKNYDSKIIFSHSFVAKEISSSH